MSCMSDMTPTSLAAAVVPRTDKIIKNIKLLKLRIFERGENLLQHDILHFVFNLSQSSEVVLQSNNPILSF